MLTALQGLVRGLTENIKVVLFLDKHQNRNKNSYLTYETQRLVHMLSLGLGGER